MLFQCIDGRSPLHMTAVHGRFTRAQTLFEHGERVLISACSGVSALKSVKFVNLKKNRKEKKKNSDCNFIEIQFLPKTYRTERFYVDLTEGHMQ